MKTLNMTCIAAASTLMNVPEVDLLHFQLEEARKEGHTHLVLEDYPNVSNIVYALTPPEAERFKLLSNQRLFKL